MNSNTSVFLRGSVDTVCSNQDLLSKVQPFFDDVKYQLAHTHHFGILQNALNSDSSLTREKYVLKHCALLFKLKNDVPYLGLGSKNGFKSVKDFQCLKEWNGVETCQSWAVLLNAGHLFGTFATERALLFHMDRNLDDREQFIKQSIGFDRSHGNKLRGRFERAINEAQLMRFHYLLSLWRLRTNGVSQLNDQERKKAQLLIKAFLDPPSEGVRRWQDVYRRTRRLTYLEIHGLLKDKQFITANANLDGLDLKALFPVDSLPNADWSSQCRWQAIDAIERDHTTHLFGTSEAASAVLSHIEHFKPWFKEQQNSGADFTTILDNLFGKPSDWREPVPTPYRSFISLQVPVKWDWLTETRLWMRDEHQENPWGDSNFLLTPDPGSGPLVVELYSGKDGLSISALRQSVVQLGRAFVGSLNIEERHLLWMSSARLIARAFKACLKDSFDIQIQPVHGSDGHIGYASISDSYELARGFVKGFLVACQDEGRENELRQLLSIIDTMNLWRAPAMIMLARTIVVDGCNQQKTDIDGLCGFFQDDVLHWVVVECKEGSGGAQQLRKNLNPCLTDPLKGINKVSHQAFNAWHGKLDSPQML